MTALSDLAQILLTQQGPARWICIAIAVSLLLLAWRTGLAIGGRVLSVVGQGLAFVWAKSPFNFRSAGWFWRTLRFVAIVSLVGAFAPQIHDWLQQTYTAPAYAIQHDDPEVAYAFEREIDRHLTMAEASSFRQRIAEIAAKIGSTPLALMEVGFSECGLNPFALNVTDGRVVAAGFIQFTAAGLTSCLLDGEKVSMEQVKDWCRTRNLERIMALTEAYFDAFAKGRPLPRPIDIYLCVFAPAFIGAGPDAVLYERSKWEEAYNGNKYFDGYLVETRNGKPLILRLNSAMDGRITVGELALHLEKKKSLLVAGLKKKKDSRFSTKKNSPAHKWAGLFDFGERPILFPLRVWRVVVVHHLV